MASLLDLLGVHPPTDLPYLVYGGSPKRFWAPTRQADGSLLLLPYHCVDALPRAVRVGDTLPDCYKQVVATAPGRLQLGDIVAFCRDVAVPTPYRPQWEAQHQYKLHYIVGIETAPDKRTTVPDVLYRFRVRPLTPDGLLPIDPDTFTAVVQGSDYLYRLTPDQVSDPMTYAAPPFARNARRVAMRTTARQEPAKAPGGPPPAARSRRIRIRT